MGKTSYKKGSYIAVAIDHNTGMLVWTPRQSRGCGRGSRRPLPIRRTSSWQGRGSSRSPGAGRIMEGAEADALAYLDFPEAHRAASGPTTCRSAATAR